MASLSDSVKAVESGSNAIRGEGAVASVNRSQRGLA